MQTEARDTNPKKVFLVSGNFIIEEASPIFFELPSPKDVPLKRKYLYSKGSQIFYEIKKFEQFASFFSGDTVIQDGSFYTVTPINSVFLALPFLEKVRGKTPETEKKMSQLDEIFNEAQVSTQIEKAGMKLLQESVSLKNNIKQVCDFMEQDYGDGDSFIFFKLNEQKLDEWLDKRLEKLKVSLKKQMPGLFNTNLAELDEKNLLLFALEVIHEYVPNSLLLKYLTKHNVTLKDILAQRGLKRKFEDEVISGETGKDAKAQETAASAKKVKTNEKLASAAKGTKSLNSFFGKK